MSWSRAATPTPAAAWSCCASPRSSSSSSARSPRSTRRKRKGTDQEVRALRVCWCLLERRLDVLGDLGHALSVELEDGVVAGARLTLVGELQRSGLAVVVGVPAAANQFGTGSEVLARLALTGEVVELGTD